MTDKQQKKEKPKRFERLKQDFRGVGRYLKGKISTNTGPSGETGTNRSKVKQFVGNLPRYSIILIFLVLLFLTALIADFFTTVRVISISELTDLNPRGGVITIKYNKPASHLRYGTTSQNLYVYSRLSKDRLTETHKIISPTKPLHTHKMIRNAYKDYIPWLGGFFVSPKTLTVTTGKERISVKRLIPAENSTPSPETFDNQLAIEFEGENVIGKYKKGVNIPVNEMTYVKLSPPTSGYYRWSNNSLLTFNFTDEKPRFETTYQFEVFPEKFVDTKKQSWMGKKTIYKVTSSANDVYIVDFSPTGEVTWQTPINIEFSGNMVGALDVLKKKSPEMVPITINPKTGGNWVWQNGRVLKFQPDKKGYPVKNNITVSINPEINTDPDRKWRAGKKSSFSFYVLPRQQSISSYNLHGDSNALETDLIVTFSRAMVDGNALHRAMANSKISDNTPLIISPKIKGNFYWIAPNKLKFHPENLWSQLTRYQIKLNPAYNPDPSYEWSGTTDFDFKTVENVVRADYFFTPENRLSPSTFFSNKGHYKKEKDVRPENRMWILFDRDLGRYLKKGTDINDAVVITPAIKGKFTWLSNRLLEFAPTENWGEKKDYNLKLTKKLLYHPEQHFFESRAAFEFSTGENLLRSTRITPTSIVKKSAGRINPDRAFDIQFSRNTTPMLKVGRTYDIKEIQKGSSPIKIEPKAGFSLLWKNKKYMEIRPTGYWKPETLYKVTLAPGILPTKKTKFQHGNFFYFKTNKNRVKITRFTPKGKVGRRIILDAEFSRKLKPKNIKAGGSDTTQLFSIMPQIKGEWVWLSDEKMQFKPTGPLAPATKYTVKFDPNKIPDKQFTWHIEPEKGKHRFAPVKYGFYTPPLRVYTAAARFEFNKKDILKQRFYLDMELSEPVLEKDLRKHFSIWYKKIKGSSEIQVPLIYQIEAKKESSPGIRKFSVVSDWIDRPARDRRIYYEISAGLKPVKGDLDLAANYSGYFTQERPKYLSMNDLKWEWKDRKYRAIVTFNAPVEPGVLERFLRVNQQSKKPQKYEVGVATTRSRGDFKYEITSHFLPAAFYSFNIKEGMMATDGAFNPEKISKTYIAPNLNQRLEFALNGSVLSSKDMTAVPVLSTNIDHFYVIIDKIYSNNVNYYINNRVDTVNISDIAKNIVKKEYAVKKIVGEKETTNKVYITHIDLSKLLKKNVHGLYRVTVHRYSYVGSIDPRSSRWFLATDTGLIARRFDDNMAVWANSLHSLQAIEGVNVEVYDRWNQVIGTSTTDYEGFVRLKLDKGATPTHLVAKKGNDFSFLDLKRHRDRLAGFDIEGISSKKTTIRSFIYSDRGVYRPGERVHLVAVTRGKEGILPKKYPVTFILKNPTGKQVVSERYTLDQQGLYIYDFDAPGDAKTGKWKATMLWKGTEVGQYTFQVEEFIPNKIKVELKLLNKALYAGDKLKFEVKATNLFGPPAADRPVSGTINLRPNYFRPEGYGKYTFGHDDNRFQRIDEELAEVRLNKDGIHIFEYQVPEKIDSPVGLTAHFSGVVIDSGGRGVANYDSTDVLLFSQYVGVRRFTKGIVNIDKPVGFKIVNVDAKGTPIARSQQKLSFTVFRLKPITHYRKNERGYYRYITEKEKIVVGNPQDTRDADGKFSYTPKYSGEHILEIEDLIGKQVTRYKFDVQGEERLTQFVEKADKVELTVLNKEVNVNREVKIEVNAPFPGKVLLIGERDTILFTRTINLTGHKQIVTLPVKASYLPNFYISAMAIKPVYEGSRTDPIYATGLVNVIVKDPSHKPGFKITMPARAVPNSDLTVTVKVADTNYNDMYFTIATVDVGILELTRYKLPEMNGYFNQKRRLEVEHYSMYPLVMPYEPEVKYTISPSGDAPSRALVRKKRVSPDSQRRVKSVALWSGLLKFNSSGEGTATFKLPDFNGTLRVMAVAFGDQRFASLQKEILVRDKLVIRPTLPRFMATGDDFVIPVSVYNGTGQDGDITVKVKTSAHLKLLGPEQRTAFVPANGEAYVDFAVKVKNTIGVSTFEISAAGVGEKVQKKVEVPVRAPGTFIVRSGSGLVDKHAPKSIKMPGHFIPGTEEFAMKITTTPLARFRNGLVYLLRYPHGCLEQTTSKLFPLLYYPHLAKSAGKIFTPGKTPRYYLNAGISKIERMQLESGLFSYWERSTNVNNWATVYASHFLVEAQKAGLKIHDKVWSSMISALNQKVSVSLDQSNLYNRSYGVSHASYMLYVLAHANENVQSKLNFIYDNYFHELKSHDRARLASAYNAAGDKETALRILSTIEMLDEYDMKYRDTGGAFASNVRDLSIVLDAMATVNPQSPKIPLIIEQLAKKTMHGRWASTQENAFAYLAIGKAVTANKTGKSKPTIRLGDGTRVPFGQEVLLKTAELLKGEVRIEMNGKGEVAYAWEAGGIMKKRRSLQQDKGMQVRRRYLDDKGEPIDFSKVRQGDLVVAEIKIKSFSSTLDNVVVTDLLPAGLEIENTRLSTSQSLPWLKPDIKPDYLDIRDDRINIFLQVPITEKTYYYTTRAVTIGNFEVPAIRAEAMYDPDIFSEADSGKIKILPKKRMSSTTRGAFLKHSRSDAAPLAPLKNVYLRGSYLRGSSLNARWTPCFGHEFYS
ncbi:MAG: alpha-2-macroglobulin family protein [bacterium]|nr:alpha-2-macroglobulin family protein [bacterium]